MNILSMAPVLAIAILGVYIIVKVEMAKAKECKRIIADIRSRPIAYVAVRKDELDERHSDYLQLIEDYNVLADEHEELGKRYCVFKKDTEFQMILLKNSAKSFHELFMMRAQQPGVPYGKVTDAQLDSSIAIVYYNCLAEIGREYPQYDLKQIERAFLEYLECEYERRNSVTGSSYCVAE